MEVRKHAVIVAFEPEVNITLDLTYDSDNGEPYTVRITALNAAGEKYGMSGTLTKQIPVPTPPTEPKAKATKKTAK